MRAVQTVIGVISAIIINAFIGKLKKQKERNEYKYSKHTNDNVLLRGDEHEEDEEDREHVDGEH